MGNDHGLCTTDEDAKDDSSNCGPLRTSNVFLMVPNLIGYVRVLLAVFACAYMFSEPQLAAGLYTLSCLLDALDGLAARILGQATRFGAVLDMVTDRCTTATLMIWLSWAYPRYMLLFQLLISLDLSSHYMHMYSSMLEGEMSHKRISSRKSWFLRLYYSSRSILFLVCAGNELFFILLYLLYHRECAHYGLLGGLSSLLPSSSCSYFPNGIWFDLALFLAGPVCLVKQVLSVIQLVSASITIANVDKKDRADHEKVD